MKTIIAIVLTSLAFAVQAQDAEKKNEPVIKEVCTDVKGKDGKVVKNKDGSNKQTCKKIKVRQKYEGTAIPSQQKK